MCRDIPKEKMNNDSSNTVQILLSPVKAATAKKGLVESNFIPRIVVQTCKVDAMGSKHSNHQNLVRLPSTSMTLWNYFLSTSTLHCICWGYRLVFESKYVIYIHQRTWFRLLRILYTKCSSLMLWLLVRSLGT